MLGMLMVAMATPFLALTGDRNQFLKWVKGGALAAATLTVALAILIHTPHFERLTSLAEGAAADGSAETRLAMARAAFDVWLSYPIAGAGFQGYSRVSEFPGRYSHTTFGEVLANGGLIGFTLIGIFYFLPALQLVAMLRSRMPLPARRLAMGLLAFWAVFTMNSLFAVQHDSKDLIPMWAGICGWIQEQRLIRMPHQARRRRNTLHRPANLVTSD
jgi:O-antigen ligase